MSVDLFHPAVAGWFRDRVGEPTAVQREAWPSIQSGAHTLLAAPTGSGKTLAGFLAVIDRLLREGLERGLEQRTRVLYVSPLKALSNDIQRNLQEPLQGIRDELLMQGLPDVEIAAWVRTGDTPQWERSRAVREPPHILVTTPESAYILLTSKSGREMLGSVDTVIVDEIHALAGNKRGAHLTLSLERLEALTAKPLQRIGISATQKPIEAMADYLVGRRDAPCAIVDTGHVRERDLALALPDSPLEAVMSNEVWQEIYDRLQALVEAHRSTLVFVNTRRLAERAARFLAERLGEEAVMAHHGSLAREQRFEAEQRLKRGDLPCLVATASLELGIDIGDVDLVCQLGSPRAIAAFLQRVGRSGHSVAATPKGRLFPLSRDDLVECAALLDAAERGELDRIVIPEQPLDVLAQQIVAEVSGRDWEQRALFEAFRRAWPYRDLSEEKFNAVVRMLAQGFSTRRGRRGAHIHHDAVNGRLRARRGARLTALTNGGAIPDLFDCDVILQPEGLRVGTLNEDFAFESLPGDIFQLGNTSYRILKTEMGKVFVEDAKGQPPNIPFWFGEAPGRSDELSAAVSRLREAVDRRLDEGGMEAAVRELMAANHLDRGAAEQIVAYLAASRAALGAMPSQRHIVLERFFDEVGDMHLVIHSPFGSRINKAWGLALRKRFCRKFNFELQAAALDDTIVLSLSATHSFPLTEVAGYLKHQTVRHLLIQALLDAPMFEARWRWNATIALAVRRNHNGKRSPPYFQRSDAEDLVAVVFPDQIACFENIAGEREVPDHPLVEQTIGDCLHDTMDIVGLERLLEGIENGTIQVTGADLTAPSPMAQEVLNARPYAFLDDAPAEERRTLAVQARGRLDPVDAAELARLDPAAIERVRKEAWPEPRTADELHDALVLLGFITAEEGQRSAGIGLDFGWTHLLETLIADRRATVLTPPGGEPLWVAAERLREHLLVHPGASLAPEIAPLIDPQTPTGREQAIVELLRSRLEGLGPARVDQLIRPLGLSETEAAAALLALEQEGFVVRGQFTGENLGEEWCERRLLARIHRYTLKRLRSEIEPVSPADFMRYLFDWQGLAERREGPEALAACVAQLEGFPVAASAWESDILPARLARYTPDQLDALCAAGRLVWLRLTPAGQGNGKARSPVRHTPIVLLARENLGIWRRLAPLNAKAAQPGANAARVLADLQRSGAAFFGDLVRDSGLLRTQVESALGELVNLGLATSDHFSGLRALIAPAAKRARFSQRRGRQPAISPFDSAGRWSLVQSSQPDETAEDETEFIAHLLLRRYGVVFRKLLEREASLPPWRDLLRVYWRMEARGEIRGGRFVQGFSGEQFALPEAVGALRRSRRETPDEQLIVLSAADPLNLVGVILPGDKIPASSRTRIVFRNGAPIAVQRGKRDIDYLRDVDRETAWQARMLLTRRNQPASVLLPPEGRRPPPGMV